jgi:hypothetical protein
LILLAPLAGDGFSSVDNGHVSLDFVDSRSFGAGFNTFR